MSDSPPDDTTERDGETTGGDETTGGEPGSDDRRDADAADHDRTDGGYGDDSSDSSTGRGDESDGPVPAEEQPHESGTETETETETETGTGGLSDRVAFLISVAFGTILAVGSIALVSGTAPLFEELLRVRPTVADGGIGAGWVVGNTDAILDAAIWLVHLADVVMGIFILLIVFIHWAVFRRLATRMQPPGGAQRRETAAATDGGVRSADDSRTERSSQDSQATDDQPRDGGDGTATDGGEPR